MPGKLLLILFILLVINAKLSGQIITTYAGNGTYGYSGDGGPAISAQLAWAFGVATDDAGNVYIADHDNDVIRKVNSAGIISTYAGNGKLGYSGDGGPATSAELYHPAHLTLDNNGNLYFTDQNADVIRKISSTGIITSITGNLPPGYSGDGGPVALAQFASITGVTPDNKGNLFISEYGNHVIRKVDAAGIITTIAGNGKPGFKGDGKPAINAQLAYPYQVNFDNAGNMYIPDAGNQRIRKINPRGIISTVAGNGVAGYSGDGGIATAASLNFPWDCTTDTAGNIFVSDAVNLVIRKIDRNGIISTYAGNGNFGYTGDGGPAVFATLADICGIATDAPGNLYIVNRTPYYVVRKVSDCLTAVIITQPSDINICGSGNAYFAIKTKDPAGYQWQVNAGSGWTNLSDNTIYSGTSTDSLNINVPGSSMNGQSYRCIVKNACASIISAERTLNITKPSTPSIIIQTASATTCEGMAIVFNATAQNSGNAPAYQWKKNGNNVGKNSAVYVDSGLKTGDIITCTLTSNENCVITNSVISNNILVTVNHVLSPAVSIVSSANDICFGMPVLFEATAVNAGTSPSYQWVKNGIDIGTDSSSYTDNSLNDGDVVACVVTSDYNCVTTSLAVSNVIVTNVTPLLTPSASINCSATSICENTPVTFNVVVTNGGSNPVYQWKKNNSNVGFNAAVYMDSDLVNGDVISCIITVSGNCIALPSIISNSITMTTFQRPVVALNKSTTLCDGSSRQLDAGNFSSYLWNTGSTERSIIVNDKGVFYVTVKDSRGCVGSDTTTINTIIPPPNHFLPNDTAVCLYGSLLLQTNTTYKNYFWSTGSNTNILTVDKAGLYWLQVTDNNDCSGRDSIVVALKDCLEGFYMPTAFTPNHDGKNDAIKPFIFGNVLKYHFVIYNRWGKIIFETNDISKGWDGTYNSLPQTTGTFIWLCYFQLQGLKEEVRNGTMVLLR